MNLGHSISQIMQKASKPFYLTKTNLTITSLIDTLGFKASSIDKKPVILSTPNSIQKAPIRFKMNQLHFPHRAET